MSIPATRSTSAPKDCECSLDVELDTGIDMFQMVTANDLAGLSVSVEVLEGTRRDKLLELDGPLMRRVLAINMNEPMDYQVSFKPKAPARIVEFKPRP